MRYLLKALYLYSRSWGIFDLINSLYNLSLIFIDFIILFITHGLLFSFLSLLIVFFNGKCLSRTLWKIRKKVLKFRFVSIFSVARDQSIALRSLSKALILKFWKSLNTVWLSFLVMLFSLKFSNIRNCRRWSEMKPEIHLYS